MECRKSRRQALDLNRSSTGYVPAEGIRHMDYREDQTIVDFRSEVKSFISDNLPSDWGSGSGAKATSRT